jgi:DNA invertase Pin-like site-specific DNA recombinase
MNGMAFDLSSPYGRMLATFLSGIAEFERDLISEPVINLAAKAMPELVIRRRIIDFCLSGCDSEGRSFRWISAGIAKSALKRSIFDTEASWISPHKKRKSSFGILAWPFTPDHGHNGLRLCCRKSNFC